MLLSKIGKNKNRIFARKCEIKFIDNKEASIFMENNHIQGQCKSSINIGLYYKKKLVSAMTFGKSRFNKNYNYELLRYCNVLNTTIIGGFSKCLKFFKNNFIGTVISYADKRYSNGNIYLKNNFKLINESLPNYFYFKNANILENRIKYQKHKLKNILEIFDSNLTEWENMQLNDYDRIWDCGNLVFELK
jgi:hypothetical protein